VRRFEFKLQRLARVRKVQEDLARAAWQAAESVVREAEHRLEAAEASVGESLEDLRRLQSSPELVAARLVQAQEVVARLAERRDAIARQLPGLRAEADRLREPWQALRTELEGLARLEEKARDRHRAEALRAEAAETDQVAMERARLKRADDERRGA
jgi:flagellar export protein FliJ